MKKIYGLMLLIVIPLASAFSQDPHFTQIAQTPLLVSPTNTGVSDADGRVQLAARHQWAGILGKQAFRTIYASYDQRKLVGRNDFLGIGGALWNDQAGHAQLATTAVSGMFSYAKNIYQYRDRASYILAGGQFGYTSRQLKTDKLTWSSQYDGLDGFDTSLNSNEELTKTRFGYLDMGAGLQYYYVNAEKSFQVGLSYYHFNKPKASFFDNKKEEIRARLNFHFGACWNLPREHLAFLINGLIQAQGPLSQAQVTGKIRHLIGRNGGEFIEAGVGTRMATGINNVSPNALLFQIGYQYNHLRIGFSYDMALTALQNTDAPVSTYELTVGYLLDMGERRGVICPRF